MIAFLISIYMLLFFYFDNVLGSFVMKIIVLISLNRILDESGKRRKSMDDFIKETNALKPYNLMMKYFKNA